MYHSIVYCVFVISALGGATVRHVVSLPNDVIYGGTSNDRSPSKQTHETGNHVRDDVIDNDRSLTGSQVVPNQSSDLAPPNGANRAASLGDSKPKFLFGRNWLAPVSSQDIPLSHRAPVSTDTEFGGKRHDSRRHFKFGKKSSDRLDDVFDEMNSDNDDDNDDVQSLLAYKRKMIKFGKRSVGNDASPWQRVG